MNVISGLCRVIKVPNYIELNSLYGTTGTATETYLKNAHRWLNENRESLRILIKQPYVLDISPNSRGIGLYYTYEEPNRYNLIYYFGISEFVKGGYVNENWNYKVII